MTNSINTESPFYKVLEAWGQELLVVENGLPDGIEPTLTKSFTLKNGLQVQINIGRDLYEVDED